jgi:hypothetical protein
MEIDKEVKREMVSKFDPKEGIKIKINKDQDRFG